MKSKKRLPLYILSFLFYGSILFLTLHAWDIRCAGLPQVTVGRLEKEEFSYTVTNQAGQTFEATYDFFLISSEELKSTHSLNLSLSKSETM